MGSNVNTVDLARTTYHHGDLPAALLSVADELIAEKGRSGFSLREAARRLGVDPAACYRHFRDKDAVLQALAQRGFTELSARMRSALEALERPTPRRRLIALGRAYLAFAEERPSTFRITFGPLGMDARDVRLRGEHAEADAPINLLLHGMARWAERYELSIDVEAESVKLWCATHGTVCLLIDGAIATPAGAARTALLDGVVDTVLAGIRRRARRR